ncbi:MAG: hypothetical protein ABIW84_03615 [Ilumatobacteraceae bacterium]
MTASPSRVQYRVLFAKKDEVVEGPDDADIVISVAATDAALDPAVGYMRGKLKATGSTNALFELFKSGEIEPILTRLATR